MRYAILIFTALLWTTPAMADKPEWAGKGKPTAEQKSAHKAAMNAKEEMEDDYDRDEEDYRDKLDKEKKSKKSKKSKQDKRLKDHKSTADHDDEMDREDADDAKGAAKQYQKKMTQEQKELDKGSDQGREARGQRRKWWQFWQEKTPADDQLPTESN